jgi:hypothetical protein
MRQIDLGYLRLGREPSVSQVAPCGNGKDAG